LGLFNDLIDRRLIDDTQPREERENRYSRGAFTGSRKAGIPELFEIVQHEILFSRAISGVGKRIE
jgi:hypothetical protein